MHAVKTNGVDPEFELKKLLNTVRGGNQLQSMHAETELLKRFRILSKPSKNEPDGPVSIEIGYDTERGNVTLKFSRSIAWIAFDALGIAGLIQSLGGALNALNGIKPAEPPPTN
jgi:hypothetical protein